MIRNTQALSGARSANLLRTKWLLFAKQCQNVPLRHRFCGGESRVAAASRALSSAEQSVGLSVRYRSLTPRWRAGISAPPERTCTWRFASLHTARRLDSHAAAILCARLSRRIIMRSPYLVCLSSITLLLSCQVRTSEQLPKCSSHQRASIEAALRADLLEMRRAINDFQGDNGRPPRFIGELVPHYIRRIPVDPTTHSAETWRFIAASHDKHPDVRSGSLSNSCRGARYAEW